MYTQRQHDWLFFYFNEVIYLEFFSQSQIVNHEHYKTVLQICIHHNNVPTHSALLIYQFCGLH